MSLVTATVDILYFFYTAQFFLYLEPQWRHNCKLRTKVQVFDSPRILELQHFENCPIQR